MKIAWTTVITAGLVLFAAGGSWGVSQLQISALGSDVGAMKTEMSTIKTEVTALKTGRDADAARLTRIENALDRLNDKTDRLLVKLGDRGA